MVKSMGLDPLLMTDDTVVNCYFLDSVIGDSPVFFNARKLPPCWSEYISA